MSMKQNASNSGRKLPAVIGYQKYNRMALIPLIIISAILPFIMRLYSYNPKLMKYAWFPNVTQVDDIFLYYKQVILVVLGIVMFLILIGYYIFKGKNKKILPIFIPLIVYAVLIILSSVASKYSEFSYSGIYDQFESVFVLLSYCIIVVYSFKFVQTEEDVRLIIKGIICSVIVLSILGITQITSNDFLQTTVGEKLYMPKQYWNQLDVLDFQMENNRVYLTFYNPNYVGVYVGLILPVIISLLFFSKKVWHSVVYIISILGLLVCLIGSKSKTAIIGLAVAAIIVIIMLRKQLMKKWYFSLIALIGCIVVFLGAIVPSSPFYFLDIKSMFHQSAETKTLDNIWTKDDRVTVDYKGNLFNITMVAEGTEFYSFGIYDDDYNFIEHTVNDSNTLYTITDERFSGITIEPITMGEYLGFNVLIDQHSWCFTNQVIQGKYLYYNAYGKFDFLNPAKTVLFQENESFGSHRGYIWSRTIPLLKDNILLGTGADTFSIVFPQQDYVGLYNNGFEGNTLTKPHSMFLQIGVQTGVISLIAFLAFYAFYFIGSIKLYINNKFDSYFSQVGVSIFIGTVSFMVCCISNDSNVCTSPVFWTLMGVGIAINSKIKHSHNGNNSLCDID